MQPRHRGKVSQNMNDTRKFITCVELLTVCETKTSFFHQQQSGFKSSFIFFIFGDHSCRKGGDFNITSQETGMKIK